MSDASRPEAGVSDARRVPRLLRLFVAGAATTLVALVAARSPGVSPERALAASLAQQPATATPGVPAGPPIVLAGKWSVTRTYWRSCPRCGTPIIRTTPWVISQVGPDIRVDRGLRGFVMGSGPALLNLEGTESEGFSVQRFWYATLRVSADGRFFEGAFNGSETMQNPCGSDPPAVTCFVSGGWIQGFLVAPAAAPTATATPVPTDTPTPRPIAPAPAATAIATAVLDAHAGQVSHLPAVLLSR